MAPQLGQLSFGVMVFVRMSWHTSTSFERSWITLKIIKTFHGKILRQNPFWESVFEQNFEQKKLLTKTGKTKLRHRCMDVYSQNFLQTCSLQKIFEE